MGGNAFKTPEGQFRTVPIPKQFVEPTLQSFFARILNPSGVDAYTPIGSTGKRAFSSDLDIAVPGTSNAVEWKIKLSAEMKKLLGPENVKTLGAGITAAYPIVGADGLVQIDIFLVRDLEGTAWLMSGSDDESVKGAYRNLLLSLIAKQRSIELTEKSGLPVKITISFPGGIQVTRDGDVVIPRTTDPDVVLSALGLGARPDAVKSFESLADYMQSHPDLRVYLDFFAQYIESYIHTDPDNAKRALDYIDQLPDKR